MIWRFKKCEELTLHKRLFDFPFSDGRMFYYNKVLIIDRSMIEMKFGHLNFHRNKIKRYT